MGKLSAEQEKELARLEALRDADDDEETVVWVRKGDHETRLTGERAKRWLRANGYDEEDAEDSTAAAPLEEKGAATKAPKAPKKATAAAKKAGDDDDGDDELASDEPAPQRNRRAFF